MLRDETDLSLYRVYIGHVEHSERRFAKLVPDAVADADGWTKIEDIEVAFPDSGNVLTTDPMAIGHKGRILLFTVRENPANGHDRFVTDQVDEPYEIRSEFLGMPTREQRLAATIDGVKRFQQLNPTVILPLDDSSVTVVPMKADHHRWRIATDFDLMKIPVYESGDLLNTYVAIEGRTFALPGLLPRRYSKVRNWADDGDFLESILRSLKKHDELNGDLTMASVSRAAIDRLKRAYRQAGVLTSNVMENSAILERLDEFLQFVPPELKAISRISGVLAHNKSVMEAVEAEMEMMRADARRRAEREVREGLQTRIENEMAAGLAQLQGLREEIKSLETAKTAVAVELTALNEARANELHAATDDLQQLLRSIEKVGRSTDTIFNFMQLAGIQSNGLPSPTPSAKAPPWAATSGAAASSITLSELADAARLICSARGLDCGAMRRFDIAVRSGRIPMLGGDAAEDMLESYAGIVCGGVLHKVAIDATVLGPDDLWNRTTPSGTSLQTAWAAATENPDRLQMVVLLGLSHGNLSPWFRDFVTLFVRHRPDNLILAALATEGTIEMGNGGIPDAPSIVTPGSMASAVALLMEDLKRSERPPTRLARPFTTKIPPERAVEVVGTFSQEPWFSHENARSALAYLETAMEWYEKTGQAIEVVREIFGTRNESGEPTT